MPKRSGAPVQGNQGGDPDPNSNDREIMRGGPGDPPDDAARQPLATSEDLVDVTIGGKSYKVPKAVASHYDQQTSDVNSRFDRLEQALGALRAPPTQPTRKQPAPSNAPADDDEFGDVDLDTMLLAEPRKAAKIIADRAVARAQTQWRGEYTAEQARTKFWNDFYAKNDDLKKHSDLVDMVFGKNWSQIGSMTPEKATEFLANASRQTILSIRGEADPDQGTTRRRNDRTRSEGESTTTRRPAGGGSGDDGDDEKIMSLTAILKQRAERRRAKKSA